MINGATCKNCEYRKAVAKAFDIHIDWRDCWYKNCKYKQQKVGDTE